jgi:hypothetical protein
LLTVMDGNDALRDQDEERNAHEPCVEFTLVPWTLNPKP